MKALCFQELFLFGERGVGGDGVEGTDKLRVKMPDLVVPHTLSLSSICIYIQGAQWG